MIEINLLPLELREKKKITLEEIFKIKLIVVVLGGLFLFHLFLVSLDAINTKRLNSLKSTWQGLSSKREHLKQLNKELGEINAKIPLIEQLIRKRLLWSNKLNCLSDLMVNGVWLNELSLQTKEPKVQGKGSSLTYLIIRGSCASRTKDEPALIGKFMQNLKNDPTFSADFLDIELGPIKKRKILQTEIMDFILICQFK